jgi:RNA polymerase sigma factor for flagellar operon FliA
MVSNETLQADWKKYQATRDSGIREQMLIRYLPLVKQIAGRLLISLPKSVSLDELVSSGIMGLISAVDNYDPSMGFKFETYAASRVKGSIYDGLREMDWVPRSIRQKARQLERAMESLYKELGRIPEDQEMADKLELSVENYHVMLNEVSVTSLLSLDEVFVNSKGDSAALSDFIEDKEMEDIHKAMENDELKKVTIQTLKELPEQEKLVMALYYYEEMTLKEIGMVMDISESRVSQIHTKAIIHLRSRIKETLSA